MTSEVANYTTQSVSWQVVGLMRNFSLTLHRNWVWSGVEWHELQFVWLLGAKARLPCFHTSKISSDSFCFQGISSKSVSHNILRTHMHKKKRKVQMWVHFFHAIFKTGQYMEVAEERSSFFRGTLTCCEDINWPKSWLGWCAMSKAVVSLPDLPQKLRASGATLTSDGNTTIISSFLSSPWGSLQSSL